MQNRKTVLLLGIGSILILISVQVFIITDVWKQKDEMFAIRYSIRSQEALGFLRREMSADGFDTVRFLLDNYSNMIVDDLFSTTEDDDSEVMRKAVLDYFTRVVNQEEYLSDLLKSYFEWRGYEKEFEFSIDIGNLEMISGDTIIIHRTPDFTNMSPQGRGIGTATLTETRGKILVNRFRMEGNNYRFFFFYYIDFSNKQKVILKETSASLGFSSLSIILVGIMFMITYRNLIEEQRLSNLKTDFINNMTHELKTPLSTITVAGRTLEMDKIRKDEEKILETAKLIGKQSVHLNQLINMILEISMWERTQFQIDKKKTNIEELMNDIVVSFRSGYGNGATIKENYDFDGAYVDLDIVYFTTLINNLLSNAVKYSEKEPVIAIEGTSRDNNIVIKVTDNGVGIGKSDQKQIFDKFYRTSSGNIHKFKGLGLGLYYVRKIAEAHGGDVTVNSKPGKGSIFTVIIPINI